MVLLTAIEAFEKQELLFLNRCLLAFNLFNLLETSGGTLARFLHLSSCVLCPNMKKLILVFILLLPTLTFAVEKADMVLVNKYESKLYLMKNGKIIKEYHVAFGANPTGHKQQKGDERTPEGKYILDYKVSDSSFYKSIHISYPNEQDKLRAKQADIDPGGLIMIHGQKNGLGLLGFIAQRFNWTDGCIAVKNSEMDEIWQAVDVGTPIEIKP